MMLVPYDCIPYDTIQSSPTVCARRLFGEYDPTQASRVEPVEPGAATIEHRDETRSGTPAMAWDFMKAQELPPRRGTTDALSVQERCVVQAQDSRLVFELIPRDYGEPHG
jgi:hypothetical protein